MDLKDRVTQLEDELKILKNEVQSVLLDLRESLMNHENPFNTQTLPTANQPIIINKQPVNAEGREEQLHIVSGQYQENERRQTQVAAGESALIYPQESTDYEETAREEVKWAEHLVTESRLHPKLGETANDPDGKLDLATIDRLTQWVTEANGRLGRKRIEVILDVLEMVGHVVPDLKNILLKFITTIPDEYSGEVTTRDYLVSLIELDSLLGRNNKTEAALLAILCQESNHR